MKKKLKEDLQEKRQEYCDEFDNGLDEAYLTEVSGKAARKAAEMQRKQEFNQQKTDKPAQNSEEGEANDPEKEAKIKQQYLQYIQQLKGIKDYQQYLQQLRKICQDDNSRKILLWGIQKGIDGNGQNAVKGQVKVTALLPTQNEIGVNDSLAYPLEKDPSGIPKLFKNPVQVGPNPIVVFNDGARNYVLDGHHRWSQVYMFNPNATMNAFILKKGFASGPVGALKNLQLIIGAGTGDIPSSNANGINIYTAGDDQLKNWIAQRLKNSVGQRALEIFNKATGQSYDANQLLKYFMKNILNLKRATGQWAKKMPPRSEMPQTNKGPSGVDGTIGYADNVVTESKKLREAEDDSLIEACKEKYGRLIDIADSAGDFSSIKEVITAMFNEVGGKVYFEEVSRRYASFSGSVKGHSLWNSVSLEYQHGDLYRLAEDLTMAFYRTNGGQRVANTYRLMDIISGKVQESLNKKLANTKINIRESLNKYDVRTDNKYDLRNLYDACIMTDKEKRIIAEMIYNKVRADVLYEALMNKFEGKSLTEDTYKRFRRKQFDVCKVIQDTLFPPRWDVRVTNRVERDGDEEFHVLIPFPGSMKEIASLYNAVAPKLKGMGAQNLKKEGNSHSTYGYIRFTLTKEAQEALLKDLNAGEDEREASYKTSIENADISAYKPSDKVLDKLRAYRDKGSKVNAGAIKSLDKALTYLWGALLLDMETRDLERKAEELGADPAVINAIYEFTEAAEKDERSTIEIDKGIPKSGLFTFDSKNCWLPKQFFQFLIDHNIPARFLGRKPGSHFDRNGVQWTETERVLLFPGTDKEHEFDVNVHTLESGGKTTYSSGGTDLRVGIGDVLKDLAVELKANNKWPAEKEESLKEGGVKLNTYDVEFDCGPLRYDDIDHIKVKAKDKDSALKIAEKKVKQTKNYKAPCGFRIKDESLKESLEDRMGHKYSTACGFDLFHDGDYDEDTIRDRIDFALQDASRHNANSSYDWSGYLNCESIDWERAYNEDDLQGHKYATSIRFDVFHDGDFDPKILKDQLDQAIIDMGCDWSGYIDAEDNTDAYSYGDYGNGVDFDVRCFDKFYSKLDDKSFQSLSDAYDYAWDRVSKDASYFIIYNSDGRIIADSQEGLFTEPEEYEESLKESKSVMYIIKDKHGNQLSRPNDDDSELWDRVESMDPDHKKGLKVVAYTGENESLEEGWTDIDDKYYVVIKDSNDKSRIGRLIGSGSKEDCEELKSNFEQRNDYNEIYAIARKSWVEEESLKESKSLNESSFDDRLLGKDLFDVISEWESDTGYSHNNQKQMLDYTNGFYAWLDKKYPKGYKAVPSTAEEMKHLAQATEEWADVSNEYVTVYTDGVTENSITFSLHWDESEVDGKMSGTTSICDYLDDNGYYQEYDVEVHDCVKGWGRCKCTVTFNEQGIKESLKEAADREVDRKGFKSLIKYGVRDDGGNYAILNDGYLVRKFWADNDDEAKEIFRRGPSRKPELTQDNMNAGQWYESLKEGLL